MDSLTLEQKRELAKELSIRKSKQGRGFPLTSSQMRLWLHFKAYPESPTYIVPNLMELPKCIDLNILYESISIVFRLHDILNGVFEERDGSVYQCTKSDFDITYNVRQLDNIDHSNLMEMVCDEILKPFDLFSELPARVVVFHGVNDVSYLLLMAHHIVCDGGSIGILCQQIVNTYTQLSQHRNSVDCPKPRQYREYMNLQHGKRDASGYQELLVYWKNRIEGANTLDIPSQRKRPPLFSFKGKRKIVRIPDTLANKVKMSSRNQRVTLFMYLLAAYRILLYRYSNQKDTCIGVPITGRNKKDYESTVGMFVNTLPFRSEIIPEERYSNYLQRVKKECIEDLRHAEVNFEDIVMSIEKPAEYSRTPVFQSIFQLFQDRIFEGQRDSDWKEVDLEDAWVSSKVDLAAFIKDRGKWWDLVVEYNTDLYDESYIVNFARHYIEILQVVACTPDIRINDIDILTEGEKTRLFREFNCPEIPDADTDCIHKWFERQVKRTPDAVAIMNCPDSAETINGSANTLTYTELNDKANQLAWILHERHDVETETLVALCIEPSFEMIIGIMGILKAGGAYLPINPGYPVERIEYMLQDAGVKVLLHNDHLPDHLNYSGVSLNIADLQRSTDSSEHGLPSDHHVGQNLAYCIYTSGSTGKPKGVLIEHRNVTRLFTACQPWFNFDQNDVWTLFHYFGFDFSVWEIFGPLLFGGRLLVVPHRVTRTPGEFYRLLQDQRVTVLSQTPSAFRLLIAHETINRMPVENLSLRHIVFGGEALSFESLRPWIELHGDETPRLVNMYGITETTVHVTYRKVLLEDLSGEVDSDVGVPIPDLNVYILNEFMKPQPVGVPGEIYVSGRGVSRGYLNRQELTASRFVDNPFRPDDRIYRSGDLARWLPNGSIEYLGRIDNQIKINGFRIELGEVEQAFRIQQGVSDCLVTVYEDEKNAGSLCAYIVCVDDLDIANLLIDIAKLLPDYMTPSHIIKLDSLPLNVNGKIDRNRLPDPMGVMDTEIQYAVPATEIERDLAKVWQQVLGIERIGIQDSFTRLGGNSIKAVELMSRMRDEFDIDLSIAELFTNNTIAAIAKFIEADRMANELRMSEDEVTIHEYMEEI